MTLRASHVPLPRDVPDQVGILRFMERVKALRQREPFVREIAVRQLAGLRDNDQRAQAARLLNYVSTNLIYVRDPVGTEYITDPVELLARIQRGERPAGDCDDHSLLLAAMLGACGIETRLAGVKLGAGADWNHVIVRARVAGEWRDLDPCAKRSGTPIYTEHLQIDDNPEPTTKMNRYPQPYRAPQAVNGYAVAINWSGFLNGLNMLGNTATNVIGAVKGLKSNNSGGGMTGGGAGQPIYVAPKQEGFIDKHGPTLLIAGFGVAAVMMLRNQRRR